MPQLPLKEYASFICLDKEFVRAPLIQEKVELVIDELLEVLLQEPGAPKEVEMPRDKQEKRTLLRALLTIRAPKPLDAHFLAKINSLLQTELNEKDIVDVDQLEVVADVFPTNPFRQSDKFVLWQGDITRLNADVIVNAANKQMLGCFQPLHACIDNAIHSAAGPQLRDDCDIIMTAQQELEETGQAKITRAYNLPSRFVLHTVGPIVSRGTMLTVEQKEALASCYRSCLDVAHEVKGINTIAFCAISTGVFGFPKTEAANIAVQTVNDWLAAHPHQFEKIIFNVFSEDDFNKYANVFNG